MDFWERVETEVKRQNTTFRWVALKLGKAETTVSSWRKERTLPRVDEALELAEALGTTIQYLVTGDTGKKDTINLEACAENCPPYSMAPDVVPVPILEQKVAAGHGQMMMDSAQVIGTLPFLKRMLRGANPSTARALEVRGDSMTGVEIFDGDLVVFVPGQLRGDGIYVLRVGDELIVKRVEFDAVSRKIRIMSENARYPDRVESADGQMVEVVGKVYGWVHAHPY